MLTRTQGQGQDQGLDLQGQDQGLDLQGQGQDQGPHLNREFLQF